MKKMVIIRKGNIMNYILFMIILFVILFGTLGIVCIDLIKTMIDNYKEEKQNERRIRFNNIMSQTDLRA